MAASGDGLTPGSVFAIILSLAIVGGATIYYIKKKDEPWGPHEHRSPPPTPPTSPQRTQPSTPPQMQAQSPRMPPAVQRHALPASPPMQPPMTQQPPFGASHQWTQPPPPPAQDIAQVLAQAAASIRAPWQQGVDDITVLITALQNPQLSNEFRAYAQQVLAAAHIDIHAHAPHHPRASMQHPAAPPPYAAPTHMPPHQQDVGLAQPWQDFSHAAQQFGDQASHWMQDLSHGAPPVPPHVMPSLDHPSAHVAPPVTHVTPPSAQDLMRPTLLTDIAHGPRYWADVAMSLGLIKKGDPLISVREAQQFINMLNMGVHLKEDNLFGDKTRDAIKAFQHAHNLPMTGVIDSETSAALLYAGFMASGVHLPTS